MQMPKIVQFEGAKAMGLLGVFNPMDAQIGKLWDDFVPRMSEVPNQAANNHAFGICTMQHPDINTLPSGQFIYMASLAVDAYPAVLPQGMTTFELPAGKYAVFTHTGKLADFGNTVRYIYDEWLKTANRADYSYPDFELYDERFDPNAETGEIDIYIPVL
ncbi:MAG: GyrI-like domain-containing protein [Sphingobacteriales bacterium]|jgi:AraC family transcriptional regulator|nr:GyrI-like domain-containing protein [Sphingobacteriales bacterium]MDA0198788.1 GyrI-like domain-containing protein [Bacteroidota bacterium]